MPERDRLRLSMPFLTLDVAGSPRLFHGVRSVLWYLYSISKRVANVQRDILGYFELKAP